jgi:hypothetical protein
MYCLGTEFWNQNVYEILKKHNVRQYGATNIVKAAIAER